MKYITFVYEMMRNKTVYYVQHICKKLNLLTYLLHGAESFLRS